MQQIIYTNPLGKSVVFKRAPPYVFENLRGVSSVEAQPITTESAGQDGKTFHQLTLSDREISLTAHVEGINIPDMYRRRQELCAVMNSALHRNGSMGMIEYINDDGSYIIPAIVKLGPDPNDRKNRFNHISLRWYCPNPYFRSKDPVVVRLAYLGSGFKFPLVIPEDEGVQFGLIGYHAAAILGGDSETPVEIRITGPAYNPKIINVLTGEFIRVKRTLVFGDELNISTGKGEKRVKITRANGVVEDAFGYIDLASTFFQLSPGENPLEYETEDNTTKSTITITAYARFGGV